jgi:drug/metabolite transporter (DMT)-like permease
MTLYFLIAIDIFALAAAQLMLKKGALLLGTMDFSLVNLWGLILAIFKNFYIFGGLFLMGIGFFTWLFILSRVNLSLIYPISASLTLVMIIAGSLLFFKESLDLSQIIGIAAIIFGIFLALHR